MMRRKGCVKQSFTYPLAPQVIQLTYHCKTLRAAFAIIYDPNRFLRARKKAVLFIRKEWLLTFVGNLIARVILLERMHLVQT